MDQRGALQKVKRNHHERRVRTAEAERLAKIGRDDAVTTMRKEMDAFYVECLKVKQGEGIKQDHSVSIKIGSLRPALMLAEAERMARELEPAQVIARCDAGIKHGMAEVARLRLLPTSPENAQAISRWTQYAAKLQQHREGIVRG